MIKEIGFLPLAPSSYVLSSVWKCASPCSVLMSWNKWWGGSRGRQRGKRLDPHLNLFSLKIQVVLSSVSPVLIKLLFASERSPQLTPPPNPYRGRSSESAQNDLRAWAAEGGLMKAAGRNSSCKEISATCSAKGGEPISPLIGIGIGERITANQFSAVSIKVWLSINSQEKMASLIGFACYRLAPDYFTPCRRWNGKVILIWIGMLIGIFTRLNVLGHADINTVLTEAIKLSVKYVKIDVIKCWINACLSTYCAC